MLSTTMSACSRSSDGASADATATRTRSSSVSTARNASRSVVSSPATSARVSPALVEKLPDRRPLVRVERRQHLEHLAAEAGEEALGARPRRDLVELGHRSVLVLAVAIVERDGQALVLDLLRRPARVAGERVDPPPPRLRLRIELEPVRADVDDPVDADAGANVVARPAADDADEPVAAGEPLQLGARLRRSGRVLGPRDDRREHAVEVEEEARLVRRGREALHQCVCGRGQRS